MESRETWAKSYTTVVNAQIGGEKCDPRGSFPVSRDTGETVKNSHFGATCQSSPWLGRISRNRLGPRETEQDDDLLLRDLGSQLLLCPGSSWWDGSSSRAQPGGSPVTGASPQPR